MDCETIQLHKQSADGLISARLPYHNQEPEMYKLLKTASYTSTEKGVENAKKLKMLYVDFVLALINAYLVYK